MKPHGNIQDKGFGLLELLFSISMLAGITFVGMRLYLQINGIKNQMVAVTGIDSDVFKLEKEFNDYRFCESNLLGKKFENNSIVLEELIKVVNGNSREIIKIGDEYQNTYQVNSIRAFQENDTIELSLSFIKKNDSSVGLKNLKRSFLFNAKFDEDDRITSCGKVKKVNEEEVNQNICEELGGKYTDDGCSLPTYRSHECEEDEYVTGYGFSSTINEYYLKCAKRNFSNELCNENIKTFARSFNFEQASFSCNSISRREELDSFKLNKSKCTIQGENSIILNNSSELEATCD